MNLIAAYTFEPGMSKQERAAVHQMCSKMGMLSKSSGYELNCYLPVNRAVLLSFVLLAVHSHLSFHDRILFLAQFSHIHVI